MSITQRTEIQKFPSITSVISKYASTIPYYSWLPNSLHGETTVADPDLELRGGGGGGGGFVLLALPASLPSVISSFFYPK